MAGGATGGEGGGVTGTGALDYLTRYVLSRYQIVKQNRVALIVVDPPWCNSFNRQIQDSPLYIALTFEPVMGV